MRARAPERPSLHPLTSPVRAGRNVSSPSRFVYPQQELDAIGFKRMLRAARLFDAPPPPPRAKGGGAGHQVIGAPPLTEATGEKVFHRAVVAAAGPGAKLDWAAFQRHGALLDLRFRRGAVPRHGECLLSRASFHTLPFKLKTRYLSVSADPSKSIAP